MTIFFKAFIPEKIERKQNPDRGGKKLNIWPYVQFDMDPSF